MSWCVVRLDGFDQDEPAEIIGAFQTKEEAEAYALRSFYLGRDSWEHLPTSPYRFVAAPWTPRMTWHNGRFYEEENTSAQT
jgi:hypothetical protein